MRQNGLEVPKAQKKSKNFRQIARKLLKFLRLVKSLGVSLAELKKQPVFPTRPYMLPGSKPFLVAVNLGQESAVRQMLKKNRFLIFQIDSVKKYFKQKILRKKFQLIFFEKFIFFRLENLVCTEHPKNPIWL